MPVFPRAWYTGFGWGYLLTVETALSDLCMYGVYFDSVPKFFKRTYAIKTLQN